MVPRYSRPEMTAIWSAENRFRIWWQIEVFAAEAMVRIGMIPADDAAMILAYEAMRGLRHDEFNGDYDCDHGYSWACDECPVGIEGVEKNYQSSLDNSLNPAPVAFDFLVSSA